MFGTRRPMGLGLNPRAEPGLRSARHRPYAEWEKLTKRRRHPLVGLASLILHAAVILLALISPRLAQKKEQPSPQSQPHIVPMVYFRPEELPRRPQRPLPKPPFAEAPPAPTPDLPSPGQREAPEHDEPAAAAPP